MMTAGSYQVVGAHAEPSDFRDYLMTQLRTREPLHLEAVPVHAELPVKRGRQPRSFTFTVRALYLDHGVETLDVVNHDTHEWLQLRIGGAKITFVLLSEK